MKYADKFMEASAWMCWYQGYEEYLAHASNLIKTAEKSGEESCLWKEKKWRGYDLEIAHPIWSVLVLMFGDYGVSPRVGWIEKDNYKDARKFLRLMKDASRINPSVLDV